MLRGHLASKSLGKLARRNLMAGACALCFTGQTAWAQTAPQPQAATQPAASQPQTSAAADNQAQEETADVIVTAQKRSERLQDIPFSVSVIGQNLIERTNLNTLADVARLTPGVEFSAGTGRQTANISIRGVTTGFRGEPTVLVYVDGFTLGDSRSVNNSVLFDLERVEVLKGPQSTLYGRNALGGVINYVTKRPNTQEFGARLFGSYGNYDAVELKGSVNIPIVRDVLAVRLSGGYQNNDGYWDNRATGQKNVNGERTKSYRAAIRFTPAPAFESYLTLSRADDKDECADCVNPLPGYDPFDPTSPRRLGAGQIDTNDVGRYVNQRFLGSFRRRFDTAIWDNTYHFPTVDATLLTGYGRLKYDFFEDAGRASGPLGLNLQTFAGQYFRTQAAIPPGFVELQTFNLNQTNESWSQEFRLTSTGRAAFRWLLGAYYFNNHTSTDSVGNIVNFPFFPTLVLARTKSTIDNLGLFVNASYDFSERLRLTGGLRYDVEDRSQFDRTNQRTQKSSYDAFLPTVSLTFKPDPATSVYATASRGYKSGGVNFVSNVNAGVPLTYAPEFIWNYELGVKGSTANRRITYDVAGYYIDWTDQQIQSQINGIPFVQNAGKTEIYGIDATVGFKPVDRLTLSAAVAYNHSEFKRFFDASAVPLVFGVNPDFSGNRTALTPRITVAVGAEYAQPISADLRLVGRVDSRFSGKRFLDDTNVLEQKPYNITNASLSVENDMFSLTAFVQNAFDTKYYQYGALQVPFLPLTYAGAPRTFGLRLDAKFGRY